MAHTSRESDRWVKTLPKSAISVDALMYGILPIPLSFITYVARVNHCVGIRMRAVRCCALQIQSTTCRMLSAALPTNSDSPWLSRRSRCTAANRRRPTLQAA